jgi:hypothetical protein
MWIIFLFLQQNGSDTQVIAAPGTEQENPAAAMAYGHELST